MYNSIGSFWADLGPNVTLLMSVYRYPIMLGFALILTPVLVAHGRDLLGLVIPVFKGSSGPSESLTSSSKSTTIKMPNTRNKE